MILLLIALVPIAIILGLLLVARPQRGVLVLIGLVPFNGLLLLVPHPPFVNGWKEALVVATVGASLLCKDSIPLRQLRLPCWGPIVLLSILLSTVWFLFVPMVQAVAALKIGYFYVLLTVVLLRNPFTTRDLDRMVSILMAAGVITGFYGIAQQIIGPAGLNAMGYEYNTAIRFAGGFLRSFSTFNQPFGFGLFVMMVILVCGSVALTEPRRWRNALFLATTPLLAVAIAVTIVRGAYLGLVVGVLLIGLARYRGLLLAVPLGLAILPVLPESLAGAIFSSSSLGERSTGWAAITVEVIRSPFGIGVGSTGAMAEKVSDTTTGKAFYQPDSQYVKVMLETGAIGLWLLAALLIIALVLSLSAAARLDDPDSALALGIGANVFAAIAASTVATYFEIFPMDVYFWVFLGVLAGLPARSTDRMRLTRRQPARLPQSVGLT